MTEPLTKDYEAGLARRKQVMDEVFVANARATPQP